MDPFTIGIAAVGLGTQIFGAFGASDVAEQQAAVSRQIAADEQRINEQKYQQMQLEGSRMQLQQFRNIQRLRSQATAAAVNQGAQFGTGLLGGLGQISSQGQENALNVRQNQEIGTNIFNINNDISAKKMQLADLGADMSEYQAWGSLGGSLVSNAGTIGALGKNAYGAANNAFSLFKPNSLSGGY